MTNTTKGATVVPNRSSISSRGAKRVNGGRQRKSLAQKRARKNNREKERRGELNQRFEDLVCK